MLIPAGRGSAEKNDSRSVEYAIELERARRAGQAQRGDARGRGAADPEDEEGLIEGAVGVGVEREGGADGGVVGDGAEAAGVEGEEARR